MRRRLATLAAASALALALALSASPVLAGSPLTRISYQAAYLGSLCGYTFTSGEVTEVFRTADLVQNPDTGQWYPTASHATLNNVWAVDGAGASYKVVGVERYNDMTGYLTAKVMFVSPGGGIVASINIVFRSYRNGDPHFLHDIGTCSFF